MKPSPTLSRKIGLVLISVAALASACGPQELEPDGEAKPVIQTWGTMRVALRDRQSEGRVDVHDLGGTGVVAVGALAELAGEVTIIDDRVLVARVENDKLKIEEAPTGTQATLLVHAEVKTWIESPLPDCSSYAELEAAIRAKLEQGGFPLEEVTPLRVQGRAERLEYHVIRGSCPIAHPEETPPWRFAGSLPAVEIVGIYVEGAAGRWTHHTHSSHLHISAPGHMGHLDEVALKDAALYLPASPYLTGR